MIITINNLQYKYVESEHVFMCKGVEYKTCFIYRYTKQHGIWDKRWVPCKPIDIPTILLNYRYVVDGKERIENYIEGCITYDLAAYK